MASPRLQVFFSSLPIDSQKLLNWERALDYDPECVPSCWCYDGSVWVRSCVLFLTDCDLNNKFHLCVTFNNFCKYTLLWKIKLKCGFWVDVTMLRWLSCQCLMFINTWLYKEIHCSPNLSDLKCRKFVQSKAEDHRCASNIERGICVSISFAVGNALMA